MNARVSNHLPYGIGEQPAATHAAIQLPSATLHPIINAGVVGAATTVPKVAPQAP
jgi:hypothetical protein